jgi:hypothetical protein
MKISARNMLPARHRDQEADQALVHQWHQSRDVASITTDALKELKLKKANRPAPSSSLVGAGRGGVGVSHA